MFSEGLKHHQKKAVGADKLRKVVGAVKRKLEHAMDVEIETPRTTPKRPRRESADDLTRYVRRKMAVYAFYLHVIAHTFSFK